MTPEKTMLSTAIAAASIRGIVATQKPVRVGSAATMTIDANHAAAPTHRDTKYQVPADVRTAPPVRVNSPT